MASGDIRIVTANGRSLPTVSFPVKGGTTAINPGEPVKINVSGSSGYYVVAVADADGTVRNMYFVGIAAKASSQTSSADGTVEVYLHQSGTLYAAKTKTANAANTDAKIAAKTLYRLVFDLTSSTYTIDDTATDAQGNALLVISGNASTNELIFTVDDQATWLGWGNLN